MDNTRTIRITMTSSSDREVVYYWPCKLEICSDCEGHGTVLTPSIREHAYSREEFDEAFDEEQQEEYFRRGGMYDVACPTCRQDRVVKVLDRDRVAQLRHGERLLRIWDQREDERLDNERMDRMEEKHLRQMGGY